MNIAELINKIIGGEAWRITTVLDQLRAPKTADMLTAVSRYALLIGGMLFGLQMLKSWFDGLRGQDMMRKMAVTLIITALLAAFVQPVLYRLFLLYVIAYPAEGLAITIQNMYYEDFMAAAGRGFASISDPNWIMFAGNIANAIVTTVVSAILFLASMILTAIMPILQRILLRVLFLLGPLCIIFAICDYTKSIAQKWLQLTLATAWFGVVAVIVQYMNLGLLNEMSLNGSNPVTTIIYAACSIILQLAAFSISAYLFGAVGSGLDSMANPAALAATVAATASSASKGGGMAAQVAGGMTKLVGGATSLAGKAATAAGMSQAGTQMAKAATGISKAGDSMIKTGNSMMGKGRTTSNPTQGRTTTTGKDGK